MPRTPIHPGEHLAEELREIGVSAAALARQIDVPVNRVTAIINGQRGVTADFGAPFGALVRHQRPVLAELAKPLRAQASTGGDRRQTEAIASPRQSGLINRMAKAPATKPLIGWRERVRLP